MATIRPATETDVPAILAIHNAAVLQTTAIWSETVSTLEQHRAWLAEQRGAGFPVLVAEAGGVRGYGSFARFRPFDGFRLTVEHSVYVQEGAQGKGLGKLLLAALIEEARGLGKRVMIGAIDSSNYASLALHEHMGFEETARMPGVGAKFGRRLDLVLMQLML